MNFDYLLVTSVTVAEFIKDLPVGTKVTNEIHHWIVTTGHGHSGEKCLYRDDSNSVDLDPFQCSFCAIPNLRVKDKAKRRVTKEIKGWINVYSEEGLSFHATKSTAEKRASGAVLACVEVTGTYEIEVLE